MKNLNKHSNIFSNNGKQIPSELIRYSLIICYFFLIFNVGTDRETLLLRKRFHLLRMHIICVTYA